MTTYETRLRGARNRLREAAELAPDQEAKGKLEAAVGVLDALLGSPQKEGPQRDA